MDEGTAPSTIHRHSAHTGTRFHAQTHTHPHAIIPRSSFNCGVTVQTRIVTSVAAHKRDFLVLLPLLYNQTG